jgi:hypothetical protein
MGKSLIQIAIFLIISLGLCRLFVVSFRSVGGRYDALLAFGTAIDRIFSLVLFIDSLHFASAVRQWQVYGHPIDQQPWMLFLPSKTVLITNGAIFHVGDAAG